MRGLDGSHGVMIPVQNVDNLSLSDEIVEACKKGTFHIYAVSSIEEGITSNSNPALANNSLLLGDAEASIYFMETLLFKTLLPEPADRPYW